MTAAGLKWYSDIKAELGKYDIPVYDISKFAKAVNGIRPYGYDVGKLNKRNLRVSITRNSTSYA